MTKQAATGELNPDDVGAVAALLDRWATEATKPDARQAIRRALRALFQGRAGRPSVNDSAGMERVRIILTADPSMSVRLACRNAAANLGIPPADRAAFIERLRKKLGRSK